MSKKDFIALADMIRAANRCAINCHQPEPFGPAAIAELATFCKSQNSSFMRDRWLGYISGENGKNGGAVKAA